MSAGITFFYLLCLHTKIKPSPALSLGSTAILNFKIIPEFWINLNMTPSDSSNMGWLWNKTQNIRMLIPQYIWFIGPSKSIATNWLHAFYLNARSIIPVRYLSRVHFMVVHNYTPRTDGILFCRIITRDIGQDIFWHGCWAYIIGSEAGVPRRKAMAKLRPTAKATQHSAANDSNFVSHDLMKFHCFWYLT